MLRRIAGLFRKGRQRPRNELHEYWRQSVQEPSLYAAVGPKRSEFLVCLVERFAPPGRILELGPNVGRNLHYLREAGFGELEAVEISATAVGEMRTRFPELEDVEVHVGTIEDNISRFDDREFACVFTMAVLEHIHADSEWIFAEMARIADVVITVEDEQGISERHFPRDYRKMFEPLGMVQVYSEELNREQHDLKNGFVARVFGHPESVR